MRKLFVLLATLLAFNCVQAQFLTWGLKAGAQQTGFKFKNADLSNITLPSSDEAKNFILEQGDKKWGFHAGAFVRLKILAVYIQPELIFSQAKSEVVLNEVTSATDAYHKVMDQKFNKFDIPIMVGAKFGPARVNLGPVASFTLSENGSFRDKMQEITGETIDNEFKGATFGYQIGVGLDILKTVTLDVRYEGSLSKLGDSVKIGNRSFSTDQRTSQLIVSVGVLL